MRFAGKRLQDNESIYGNPGSYMQDEELLPTTEGIRYPQDNRPAGLFGDGVNPTDLPGMRDRHMRGLEGGISQLAPKMIENFVDHPAVQDTGLPYIMTPNLQQLRRETMNQWQEMPVDMLRHFGIKGV